MAPGIIATSCVGASLLLSRKADSPCEGGFCGADKNCLKRFKQWVSFLEEPAAPISFSNSKTASRVARLGPLSKDIGASLAPALVVVCVADDNFIRFAINILLRFERRMSTIFFLLDAAPFSTDMPDLYRR
jgi:hypothetical protein